MREIVKENEKKDREMDIERQNEKRKDLDMVIMEIERQNEKERELEGENKRERDPDSSELKISIDQTAEEGESAYWVTLASGSTNLVRLINQSRIGNLINDSKCDSQISFVAFNLCVWLCLRRAKFH